MRRGGVFSAARDFTQRVNVGMVGVNFAIPVQLAYYTFGGWNAPASAISTNTGRIRCASIPRPRPSPRVGRRASRQGAEFVIPTMK